MIEAETETGIIEIERTEDRLEDGTMMIEEIETDEEVEDITEMMTEETEENPDGAEMMTEEIVIVETDPRQMLAADSRTWQILCLCSTCQIFQNLRQETGDLVTHIQEWKIKITVFLHLASPDSIIEEVLEANMMEVSLVASMEDSVVAEVAVEEVGEDAEVRIISVEEPIWDSEVVEVPGVVEVDLEVKETGMMVPWMVAILRVLTILTMLVSAEEDVVEVKEDVVCGKIEEEGAEVVLEHLEIGIKIITEAREMTTQKDLVSGIQKQTNQIQSPEKTSVKREDVRERVDGETRKK